MYATFSFARLTFFWSAFLILYGRIRLLGNQKYFIRLPIPARPGLNRWTYVTDHVITKKGGNIGLLRRCLASVLPTGWMFGRATRGREKNWTAWQISGRIGNGFPRKDRKWGPFLKLKTIDFASEMFLNSVYFDKTREKISFAQRAEFFLSGRIFLAIWPDYLGKI